MAHYPTDIDNFNPTLYEPAVGDGGAVVEEDGDVDTHDGDDGADVQVHHEVRLQEHKQKYNGKTQQIDRALL